MHGNSMIMASNVVHNVVHKHKHWVPKNAVAETILHSLAHFQRV